MEVHEREGVTLVEVGFVAPVPAGHEVLVLQLKLENAGWLDISDASVVIDVTTGTVYADVHYYTVLKARGLPLQAPANEPVGTLGPGWQVAKSIKGRSTGSLVSTKDSGDTNHAYTLLHLAPLEASGYR